MSEDNTTWVANCTQAWGKGRFEINALQNLAPHIDPRRIDGDTYEIEFTKVRNFSGMRGAAILADEQLETKTFDVSVDKIERLKELSGEMELLAEDALVEAEEL